MKKPKKPFRLDFKSKLTDAEYRAGVRAIGLLEKELPKTKANKIRCYRLRHFIREAWVNKNLTKTTDSVRLPRR